METRSSATLHSPAAILTFQHSLAGPKAGVTLPFHTWLARRTPFGRTLLCFSRHCDGVCGGAGVRISGLAAAAADSAWLRACRFAVEPADARAARARRAQFRNDGGNRCGAANVFRGH